MKSAENQPRGEPTEPLNRPMRRGVLAQGLMRSEYVVIARVGRKDLAQMGLAQDDDVIKPLPADRFDQSLRVPVLPG
jgi:hypothetical protein